MKKGLIFRLMCLALAALTVFSSAGCSLFRKDEETKRAPLTVISSIGASEAKGNIIPVDSDFNIITNESVSEKELKDILKIEPPTEFTIKKVSDKNYKLIPDEKFEDASLVRIKAVVGSKTAYEWAFETDGTLRVINTYPQGTARPRTGIEIKFSFIDVENFDDCFSVTPEVKGKTVHNGKSWVFIPDEDLPEGKYTVTVSGDLRTTTGKTLGKEFVFSFKVSEDNDYNTIYVDHSRKTNETFTPDESPKARIGNFSDGEIKADVRAVEDSSFDSMIDLSEESEYVDIDSVFSKLKKVDTFEFKAVKEKAVRQEYNSDCYETVCEYPHAYQTGKYVTKFRDSSGETAYHIFQVSKFSVYALSIYNSVTVWVNKTETGKPEKNREVRLGETTKKTDASGTVSFEGEANNNKDGILKILAEEDVFTTYIYSSSTYGNTDYYTDLYMESTLYAPGDTVKVWGCVVPRYGREMPDKILLQYEGDKSEEMKPDKNGCFKFSFVTTEPAGEWGPVNLIIEKDHSQVSCAWASFSVYEYELPSTTFEVETDKRAYFAGENAVVTVTATAFDGTPQKNTKLKIDVINDIFYVTTDENGKAVVNAENLGSKNGESYYFIDSENIEVSLASEEENYSNTGGTSIIIAWADYFAELNTDENDTLTVETYKINLSELNSSSDTPFVYGDSSSYKDKPVDIDFDVEVAEHYEKEDEVSTGYDFINNERFTEYEYKYVKDTVFSGRLSTRNGKLSFPMNSFKKHDGTISVEPEFKGNTDFINPSVYRLYTDEDETSGFDYSLITDREKYKIGDTVNAKIKTREGRAPSAVSSLFITASPGIIEILTAQKPEISFEFSKEYKDGAVAYAAFFDGENTYFTLKKQLISDFSFNLNVSVKPDKLSYKPGDKMILDISVSDNDGNPVSCGGVTNVIDEALYKITFNDPEVYYTDYADYFERIYSSAWDTVYYHTPEGGGGGGDGAVRTDFEDNPFFEIISTDSAGKAKVSVDLPDSVTSWHITVRAMDKEGRTGYKETTVSATLDYYLYTLGTDEFCVKDDIVTGAKAMSSLPDFDTGSKFGAVLIGKDGKETGEALTVEAKAGEYASFNFGKWPAGSYKIRISSECGKYSDSVEKEITVVDSKFTTSVVSEYKLTSGAGLDIDTSNRADVCLVDEMYSETKKIIDKLMSYSGQRFDMKLARDFARNWVAGRGYTPLYCDGYWFDEDGEYDSDYESKPDKDIELLALYKLTFPKSESEFYNNYGLGYAILNNKHLSVLTKTERLMYYTILAALDEPVISALDAINNGFEEMSVYEKIWLGLAYSAVGQYDRANTVFDYLTGFLKEKGGALYYNDRDEYTREYLTSMISLLSFRINSHESDKLIKALTGEEFNMYLPAFELINYILCYIGDTVKKDFVEINLGDETVKAEFYSTECYYLSLSPDELEKAVFTCRDCNVTAICRYYSSADTAINEGKPGNPVEIDFPKKIKKGQLFDISFTVNASEDENTVNFDFVLPAGVTSSGTYTIEDNSEDNDRYYYTGTGGAGPDYRSFHLYFSGATEYVVTVHCKASFSGDFVLEKSVATEGNDIIHIAEETNLKIA